MWWRPEHLAALDEGVRRARDGTPSLVWITGHPGQGKSSLVQELLHRAAAAGFHVLSGEGHEAGTPPSNGLLRELGVDGSAIRTAAGSFEVAQDLRELLDRELLTAPVLITVDDLQWADPESIEALVWLLRRAAGDRLLLAAAARPLSPPAHPQWRRLLIDTDGVLAVDLQGLSLPDAAELVRSLDCGADDTLVSRLWEHTAGNPLWLRVLLQEHDGAELRRMPVLPAPADLAHSLAQRWERVAPQGVALLRAVCVLGASWVDLPLAAEVADVADPATAAEVLVDAGLLVRRWSGAEARVRVYHSMIRAAVYEDIPRPLRRRLHQRAATLLSSPVEVLDHRVAAADRYDEGLATDLACQAERLHEHSAYREAARLLRLAGRLTRVPRLRETRWLDGLFEQLLAREPDDVALELDAVAQAGDEVRRVLVQGLRLIILREWIDALQVLEALPESALAGASAGTLYRYESLLGWVRMAVGRPAEQVLARLRRVGPEGIDPALYGFFTFARRQAETQLAPPGATWGTVMGLLEFPPDEQLTALQNHQLAWTGSVCASVGWMDRAVRDLRRFHENLHLGATDTSDRGFTALLGYAQWMQGDWEGARLTIRLAVESRFGAAHPLVASVAPLSHLAAADIEQARAALRDARARLTVAPWPVAVDLAAVAEVLLTHMVGSAAERRAVVDGLIRDFGFRMAEPPIGTAPLAALHLCLAQVWAGRYGVADVLAQRLADNPPGLGWTAGAAAWMRGLVAEARGRPVEARAQLRAGADGLGPLPLHRAHAHADLARVEMALGDHGAAARATRTARGEYERLGAQAYLQPGSGTGTDGPAGPGILSQLSDRERDVVALLSRGLSYAQMARELYVTRSTVAYHLGNIYAKTNTTSRHGLVELVLDQR